MNYSIPLLLLHGFTGSGLAMQELAKTQNRRTTICPDLIGHGKTNSLDKNLYTFKAIDAQLINFLNSFDTKNSFDSKKIHLLGYSMGGRIALNFAVNHPDYISSLILISSTAGLSNPYRRYIRRKQDFKLAKSIKTDGLEKFIDSWIRQPLFVSDYKEHEKNNLEKEYLEKARQQRLDCDPNGLILSLKGHGLGKMKPLWKKLPKINVPTLLITGSKDLKFAQLAQQLKAKLSNCLHIEIAETNHTPHIEKPEIVGKHIEEFLESVESNTFITSNINK